MCFPVRSGSTDARSRRYHPHAAVRIRAARHGRFRLAIHACAETTIMMIYRLDLALHAAL